MYILWLWNTIQFSSIFNMVSEPLLWPFLSSLVFISVTHFSILLLPSQQPPQSFAVEPSTSSSRRPWVSDLQPPLLRNFTLHRPLPFASSLQILLRSRFWKPRHHRRLHTSPCATQRLCSADHAPHAPPRVAVHLGSLSRASMRRYFRSRASHASLRALTHLHPFTDVIHGSPNLRRCWRHLFALAADVILWLWGFDCWLWPGRRLWSLTFLQGWIFQLRFFLSSFSRRFHFCSLFLHIVSLNG